MTIHPSIDDGRARAPRARRRYLFTALAAAGVATAPHAALAEDVVIETSILDFDPLAGMKSRQTIHIDFDRRTVTQTLEHGTTDFFGISLESVRNNFTVTNVTFTGSGHVRMHVEGETASGVRIVPNINYSFDLALDRAGGGRVSGCHDGYPAYTVTYRGQSIYAFQHEPVRLLNLFGTCDVYLQ